MPGDIAERVPKDPPPRDNYANGCETAVDDKLPRHLDRCACEEHTGVCRECGYKVTVGPSGREYGHARATNRGPDENGVRRDCVHRPRSVDPGRSRAWNGYGEEAGDD